MNIEIDETKLRNMEEDMEDLLKVIKAYDKLVTEKNELIKELEAEKDLSVKCFKSLLKLVKKQKISKESKKIIREIESLLKQ
jgi:hypothetical protein